MDQPDEIYYAGMLVFCRILKAAPGGYLVTVTFISRPTFMYSYKIYEREQEVRARIESIDSEGVILRDASDELSGRREDSGSDGLPNPEKGPEFQPLKKRKRAVDLIPPPLSLADRQAVRGATKKTILAELVSQNFTGCLTVENKRKRSRGALLFFRGRAAGCIHTTKKKTEIESTPICLGNLLPLVPDAGSRLWLHELPEEIALPMAALFLGYPVKREDDYTALDYMEYICQWFSENQGTAILAVVFARAPATCLIFIYKGAFSGAYVVEQSAYILEVGKVIELLSLDREASLEVSILPPELGSAPGYDIS